MKLQRVRFTVRGMMLAVVILSIASLLWASWVQNGVRRLAVAWRSGMPPNGCILRIPEPISTVANSARDPSLAPLLRYQAERYRQGAALHEQWERAFRRALWRPWEPIPDFPCHAPLAPIPRSVYPAGADPDDFRITTDGRWGTRAQILGQSTASSQ